MTTCQQIGGAIGLAVLVTISSDRFGGLLEQGRAPLDATVGGYTAAFWVAAGLAAAAGLIASRSARCARHGNRSPWPRNTKPRRGAVRGASGRSWIRTRDLSLSAF